MSPVVVWTEADLDGLAKHWGLSRVLTGVGADGKVTRELSFDDQGNMIHRYSGEPTRAKFGVFDLAEIKSPERTEMHAD